jgi:DNA-binding MarR family transcriptional regulator
MPPYIAVYEKVSPRERGVLGPGPSSEERRTRSVRALPGASLCQEGAYAPIQRIFSATMRRITARPERLENCACFSVRKTARAVTRAFDAALAPSGLEATQFSVLAAIAVARRFTMSELADWLGLDRTTLTRNVRPLVRAGWVAIEQGADQRRRLLQLTAVGRRRLKTAFPLWRAAQRRVIGAFGRRRFMQLLDGLADIRAIA